MAKKVQLKERGTNVNIYQVTVKEAVGLGNVDNTSDANKPISTAQAAKFSEIDTKLNKLHGSVIALTQSQFDALSTKDSETLYIVD